MVGLPEKKKKSISIIKKKTSHDSFAIGKPSLMCVR